MLIEYFYLVFNPVTSNELPTFLNRFLVLASDDPDTIFGFGQIRNKFDHLNMQKKFVFGNFHPYLLKTCSQ